MLLSLLCQHLRLMHYPLVSSVALWQISLSFLVLRSFSSLLLCMCEHTLTMWFSFPAHCPHPETSSLGKRGLGDFFEVQTLQVFLWVLVHETLLQNLSNHRLFTGIRSSDCFSKLKTVALTISSCLKNRFLSAQEWDFNKRGELRT